MLVLSSESIFPIYWILSLPCKGESYSMPFPKPVQPLSCISSSVEQRHVAFYLLSAASKLLNRWKKARQSAGERRHGKKKRLNQRERGWGWRDEGGCGTARSVWSLCNIACVRGVCEILVGWWSRTDQAREGSRNSSHFMNQQWKSCLSLRLLPQDHLDKAIELKPQDPLSYYLLGRWCYAVCEPTNNTAQHLYLSICPQTNCDSAKADMSAWPPFANPPRSFSLFRFPRCLFSPSESATGG